MICVTCEKDVPDSGWYWKKEGYRSGKSCKECICWMRREKYANDPELRKKIDESSKRWVENNREKSNAIKSSYRKNNPEKVREANDNWRKANPDKVREIYNRWERSHKDEWVERKKAYRKAWRDANKWYGTVKANAYRVRKLRAMPGWGQDGITELYKEASGKGLHVDHIIPLCHPLVCGLHVFDNLQLLTKEENSAKHNIFYID